MEFEDFVIKFAEEISINHKKTACFVGIRTDESLNRWRTIFAMDDKKIKDNNYEWTTKVLKVKNNDVFNIYPIFDWKVNDIWKCVYENNYKYNKIYDKMYLANKTVNDMRICQPYGDDQRKGLDLFHLCEPETWFKVVNRVSGANFGAIYKGQRILGNQDVYLPTGHTYKSFTLLLLSTMPEYLKEHYSKKIHRFFWYWKNKCQWGEIKDYEDKKLESSHKAPSWRRVCKCILKNDFYCKSLSFSQNKNEYEKLVDLKTKYNEL
jgi:predicted phosphoadenosine phosphosulfate sulfurtransferase